MLAAVSGCEGSRCSFHFLSGRWEGAWAHRSFVSHSGLGSGSGCPRLFPYPHPARERTVARSSPLAARHPFISGRRWRKGSLVPAATSIPPPVLGPGPEPSPTYIPTHVEEQRPRARASSQGPQPGQCWRRPVGAGTSEGARSPHPLESAPRVTWDSLPARRPPAELSWRVLVLEVLEVQTA